MTDPSSAPSAETAHSMETAHSPGAPSARDDGIQVLRRAAAALDEIAAAPRQLRLVDLQQRLALAKSTTRRLLVGLTEVGFATVDDDGRIAIGPHLSQLITTDPTHIAASFRSTLRRIADATGETVDLSLMRGSQMWFIDQIESEHRLRAVSAVGIRFPLFDTANGKAALALLEPAELNAELAGLDQGLIQRLRTEITAIRDTRVAFDRNEHTVGISAAGIARRISAGAIVAISVPAPTDRFRQHEAIIVEQLIQARESPAWNG
jgi:DNA-binding IclR family transcriptional regulator